MKKLELSFAEAIDSLNFQIKDFNIWNSKKLKEVISNIPENISDETRLLVARYASLAIKSIQLFKKMYGKEAELEELNGVIREVIISFKYNVKHSLK